MGQPIWQIKNSNLGTIAENVFFEFELEAIDTDLQPVSYSLIAGQLPDGIQLTGTSISGIPVKITGVPAEVDVDTSTQFSIRATTTTNEVSDITLDLTVSGQTVPELTTPTGQLGTFRYGEYVDLQLDAQDDDVGNTLSWSVVNNSLPDGLELVVDSTNDRIAYIRGYPVPATALPEGVDPGFDNQNFDEDLGAFGFDFGLNTVDKLFEFTISVTDGIGYDSGTYSIFLESTLIFYTADNYFPDVASDALVIGNEYVIVVAGSGSWQSAGAANNGVGTVFTATATTNGAVDGIARETQGISADNGIITVDATVNEGKIDPIVSTPAQDIGSFLHDNYFAFLFEATDFEGDQVQFKEFLDPGQGTQLPGGLTIDPDTGWLYGMLDTITTTETTYTFRVSVFKVSDPTFESDPVTYSITIRSDLANSLVISTPSTLELDNGEISELSIVASANTEADFNILADSNRITADQPYPTADIDTSGGAVAINLVYMLEPNTGQMPPGMALTSDGLLIGRPDFGQFELDEGETIFDDNETNWDGIFTFGVRITDVTLGVINQVETFTVIVNPLNTAPFENLYLVSGPTFEERATYKALATDDVIFPPASMYRDNDLYFGVAPDLRFLLANGLNSIGREQYAQTLLKNHYTRRFSFSDLKIAKAEDSTGTTKYELIYADIVDRLENNGESISQELLAAGIDTADMANRGIDKYNATADETDVTADNDILLADATVDSAQSIFIYPASLQNMRNVILNGNAITVDTLELTADTRYTTADRTNTSVGQLNLDTLPDWMTTIQDDGRALGWVAAVPIAYCLPGEASQILFNVNDSGFDLNSISFDVDRYVWDRNLTDSTLEFFFTLNDTQAQYDGVSPNGSFVGGLSQDKDLTGYTADNRIILVDTTNLTADASNVVGDLSDQTADNGNITADQLQPTVDVRDTTYTVGDLIIVDSGAVLTVDSVSAIGDVDGFTVTAIGTYADSNYVTADQGALGADFDASEGITSNVTLPQLTTTGTGDGFTITPVRQADEPDLGDEYLKFPQTNILV